MYPEDRLDALLSARRRAEGDWQRDRAKGDAAGDDELVPLLESADRLAPLRAVRPDPTFAQALEAQMLDSATRRRRAGRITTARMRQAPRELPEPRELPGSRLRLPDIGRSMLRPALVAAAAVLALGLGTLTVAAAAAGPGSPLFGLHRFAQGVQVNAAGDGTARARGHLQLARQWLVSVQNAANQHLGDPTYSDALQALRDEDAAMAYEIAQAPPGAARMSLEADLAALHADEITTLQAALAPIGWRDRIATTDTLGALGVAVPRVNGATVVASGEGWQVTLTGSGFAPGAVLLVNGRPAGSVMATSAGVLRGELPLDDDEHIPTSLGVGNPDGTTAVTSNLQVLRPGTPAATASPREHAGTPAPGGGSGGTATPSPGGGSGGTTTPSPGSDHGDSG